MSGDQTGEKGASIPVTTGNSHPKQKSASSSSGRVRISLACAGGCLILFVWLAEEVFHGGFQEYDLGIRAGIHQLASPPVTAIMRAATYLGSVNFLLVLFLVFTAIAFLARIPYEAAWLAAALAGEELLQYVLKSAFHRARPVAFFGRSPTDYSFPSGHALGSLCFYAMLAGLLSLHIRSRSARALVWVGSAVLILAIGISRIYLGVHYPSDVLAGYLVAMVWVNVLFAVRMRREGAG
jgi:undecaprenyl-diphosphatase